MWLIKKRSARGGSAYKAAIFLMRRQIAEVYIPLRSYIEFIDQPIVLFVLYITVSVQQTNLCLKMLPKMMPALPKSLLYNIVR